MLNTICQPPLSSHTSPSLYSASFKLRGGGGEQPRILGEKKAIKEIKKWKHAKIAFSPTSWHIADTWLCVSLHSEAHEIATFSDIHPLHLPFTVCLLCIKCWNQMSVLCRQHSWHQKTLHGYRDFLNQL